MIKNKLFMCMTIVLSLILGYVLGKQSQQNSLKECYPSGVVNVRLMNNYWENNVKDALRNSLDETLLDDDDKKLLFKELHEDFEPVVFCHPFIILRWRDKSGYAVFLNHDINNPVLDNFESPTLTIRQEKDSIGVIQNRYRFLVPTRVESEERVVLPNPTAFEAYVRTGADRNPKSIIVTLTNIVTNDQFFYRDLDGDGVFESVFYMDNALNSTFYSLTEFTDKFYNTEINESLSNDHSLDESELLEDKPK